MHARFNQLRTRGHDLADRIVAARRDPGLARTLITEECTDARADGITHSEFAMVLVHAIDSLRDVLDTVTLILDEETGGSFTEAFQAQQLIKAAITAQTERK